MEWSWGCTSLLFPRFTPRAHFAFLKVLGPGTTALCFPRSGQRQALGPSRPPAEFLLRHLHGHPPPEQNDLNPFR